MNLKISEILKATGGNLLTAGDLTKTLRISTDTRLIQSNEIFLPIKGENFDGHKFIKQALEKGCAGYFTENPQNPQEQAEFIISVNNTMEAYLDIARFARRKINPKVIGITGSSGKTSTKEFVYSVLATSFNTHKSRLNHNNEIGLCQTLLSMPENTDYTVIEMGMRGPGEIEILSKYSEPDIAIITNVGTAHIGRLGSIENIAKAKCEITAHLKNTGILLAYDDNRIKNFCNWEGEKFFYGKDYQVIKQESNLTEFVYKGENFKIPVMGEYNVTNAIAAIETGEREGICYEKIRQGLMNYAPVGDRGSVINLNNGAKLIVDCYNANPDSVIASISSLVKIYKNSKITLVLGDMEELGEYEAQLHKKVGNFILELPVHSLVTVGEKAKLIAETAKNKNLKVKSFADKAKTAEYLSGRIEKDCILMFKASRSMKLEEIANTIREKINY